MYPGVTRRPDTSREAGDVMVQLRWRGESLHYTDEGSGSAVLFIHGLGGNANNWLRQRRSLATHRRILTIDLPGHGRSTGTDVPFAQYAEAAQAVLDHAEVEDVTVVGLAMGARVAISLAYRGGKRVSRLTFVNTYLSLPPDEYARRVELYDLLLQSDGLEEWGTRLLEGMGVAGTPGIARGFMGSLDRIDPQHINTVFHQVNRIDQSNELRELELPIQIMVGARDRLVPASCTEVLQRLARRSVTHRFPGSGHLPYLEEPQAFDETLDAFIDS